MGLYSTLKSLTSEQLSLIAKQVFGSKADSMSNWALSIEIQSYLNKYAKKELKKENISESDIIYLWKKYLLEILVKKSVEQKLQKEKDEITNSLKSINYSDSDLDLQLEDVIRDILILLYKTLSDKEQKKLIDVLKNDLKEHNIKFTNKDIENILLSNGLIGIAGLPLVIIPIVANVMLQRLTQGFMAWIFINILGEKALEVAVLGFIAGPIGWSITIGLTILGGGFAFFKYQQEKDKITFIQTIFSIYSYSYCNRKFGKSKEK
jgi:hypothetical protein